MDKISSKEQYNSGMQQGEDFPDMQQSESGYRAQLLESKMIRKKAEEDAQLLANRIALLQLEEKKAMRKIEETKKKAQEITDLKVRNLQAQKEKEQIRKQKEEEELKKLVQNKNIKDQTKMNQEVNRHQLFKRLKEDVNTIKRTKQDTKELSHMIKNEEYSKNLQVVESIKIREKELQMRKKKQMEDVKQKARTEYQNKIENELNQKEHIDKLISQLEQQEMELIQRLQNTQSLQKEAFDDLEKALSVNLS